MENEREPKKVTVDVGSGEWVRMLCGATYHVGGYESNCHCASIREAFEAGGLAFESVALEAASEKSKADNEEIAKLREELAERNTEREQIDAALNGRVFAGSRPLVDLAAEIVAKLAAAEAARDETEKLCIYRLGVMRRQDEVVAAIQKKLTAAEAARDEAVERFDAERVVHRQTLEAWKMLTEERDELTKALADAKDNRVTLEGK